MDQLKFLETENNVFTHMTPSYGQPGRCITVKGINTINHDGELIPCPYMDLSLGNITKESLATVLERGMKNEWLGPYRDECIIGEHPEFIQFHNKAVEDWLRIVSFYQCLLSMVLAKTNRSLNPLDVTSGQNREQSHVIKQSRPFESICRMQSILKNAQNFTN